MSTCYLPLVQDQLRVVSPAMTTSETSIILVSGQIPVRSDCWDQAREIAQRHQQASRNEPGCLEFRFTRDLEDPNLLVFFERWASEAALADHLAGPVVAATNQALPKIAAGRATILKFRAVAQPFG